MNFNLEGLVVVVTGSLGLPGRQHLHALGRAGASLVVTDVDEAECGRLASELEAAGSRPALAAAVDVRPKGLCCDAARSRAATLRQEIDALVHNVSRGLNAAPAPDSGDVFALEDLPVERWHSAFNLHVTSFFLLAQVLGTEMARRGSGSIVNVVAPEVVPRSREGLESSPARAAVVQLTRDLAEYWRERGVRVNAVCGRPTRGGGREPWLENMQSERTIEGRAADPTQLANPIVFLASNASSYVTGASFVLGA